MLLETHMKLCMTELNFPEKKFGKQTKNGPKMGFCKFGKKFGN